jgi:predicted CoA-substrate-specific enzyme activase
MMMDNGMILGIDLGIYSVKGVAVDRREGRIIQKAYRRHHGDPPAIIEELAGRFEFEGDPFVAVTGLLPEGNPYRPGLHRVDPIYALILGVRKSIPQVRNIIDVGASTVTLIELDGKGEFRGVTSNNLCAAGTGSFLDNQADRLSLESRELNRVRFYWNPPPIASRCSVFAKSDLIHRQQEGYSRLELWSGLCKGMTETLLNTLLKGRPLQGPTVLTGGVSLNPWVKHWLKRRLGDQLVTVEDGHLTAAFGAALDALMNGHTNRTRAGHIAWTRMLSEPLKRDVSALRRPPLRLIRSSYPEEALKEPSCDADGNEVRIGSFLLDSGMEETLEAFLGIDVGSTTTKLCLINNEGRVFLDIYRKTDGSPVTATQRLFQALMRIEIERNVFFKVRGCVTTGSGRSLVGRIVGADDVVNEITAHAQAALWMDPGIETIFEIGGQDAKYISLKGGEAVDGNMNFICAAGTGSFLEELAGRLGVRVDDIDKKTMGLRPPCSSDRCTVFMEQDIDRLLVQGFSAAECLAAAVYSVAENYLNKVVGNRPVSKKRIVFQGATARNRALVAAFEHLLKVEVVVSPYCHVMGAFGAALRAREKFPFGAHRTRFRGLDLATRAIHYEHGHCALCSNRCRITHARIEGERERPSWGYRCGREPEDEKKREWETFREFSLRARFQGMEKGEDKQSEATIGLPMALTNWSDYPFWYKFFLTLGYRAIPTPPSDNVTLERGRTLSGADFCLPVKIALGHVRGLVESDGVDFIFLPHIIGDKEKFHQTNSYFCPMIQGFPALARNALKLNGVNTDRFLAPVVDPRLSPKHFIRSLWNGLGRQLERGERAVQEAWEDAALAQRMFQDRWRERGKAWIEAVKEKKETGLVIVGRPYNLFDFRINVEIPRRIASLGVQVLPMDHIPDDPPLGDPYRNMYWSNGRRILQSLRRIRQEGLHAVYFTNFGCGPDSFLLSYAEQEMKGWPFLILEFDEYRSDVGYVTRIEAFLDALKRRQMRPGCSASPGNRTQKAVRVSLSKNDRRDYEGRKIWIPPLSPAGSRLFAASFRAFGYDCEALSTETEEDYRLGRSLTRGSECLPLVTTTGVLVRRLKEIRADPRKHAFFMATASGPCRFGQYALLQRMILDRLGYRQLAILSPSSQNSYQGLEEGLRRKLYEAFIVSDILTKCLHRSRPFELIEGAADRCFEGGLEDLENAFESGASLEGPVRNAVRAFEELPTQSVMRPLVGIVGEIYIRCNPFCNENLVKEIENLGYEAWLVPTLEWMLYTTAMERWNFQVCKRKMWPWIRSLIKNRLMERSENRLYKQALPFLEDRLESSIEEVLREGERELPINFQGEAILTVGRASLFARDGVSAIVNCLPFGCMPGTLTSALFQSLQERFGLPVINLAYDGKGGINERLGQVLGWKGLPI